jgi:hypothetical protein
MSIHSRGPCERSLRYIAISLLHMGHDLSNSTALQACVSIGLIGLGMCVTITSYFYAVLIDDSFGRNIAVVNNGPLVREVHRLGYFDIQFMPLNSQIRKRQTVLADITL